MPELVRPAGRAVPGWSGRTRPSSARRCPSAAAAARAPLIVSNQVESSRVSAWTRPPIDPAGTSPLASEYMNETPSSTAMAPGPSSGGRDRPHGTGRSSWATPGHGFAGVARVPTSSVSDRLSSQRQIATSLRRSMQPYTELTASHGSGHYGRATHARTRCGPPVRPGIGPGRRRPARARPDRGRHPRRGPGRRRSAAPTGRSPPAATAQAPEPGGPLVLGHESLGRVIE